MATRRTVDLNSLFTKEELEQFKDIRINESPTYIQKLGRGGFGDVNLYEFKDGSQKAGKIPRIDIFRTSPEYKSEIKEQLSMTLDEVKTIHKLDNERIIKLLGIYLDKDQIIIFMEYMKGGSVRQEIDDKKFLSEFQAMHYFIQATEGLVYLHNMKPKPIVHRDIKSDNLLLTSDYNVKLADFGLAVDIALKNDTFTNTLNAPKSAAGTYHFMAPEVIRTMGISTSYGRSSDIWSLACTLVEMISGKPPHSNLPLVLFLSRMAHDSNNPLNYSGDLLVPTATKAVKGLLNILFNIDSQLRPSANTALGLAQDAKRAVVYSITDPNEQVLIASLYEEGQGVPQSYEEAAKWYKKAAERGHAGAKKKVQLITETVAKSNTPIFNGNAAKQYFDATPPNNQFEVNGNQHVNAIKTVSASRTNNTVKDLRNRFEHQIAFNQVESTKKQPVFNRNTYIRDSGQELEVKDAGAQIELGDKYYFGRGVPQSYEEAVKWFRKAAEQGNADGQYNLGVMYENGYGVDKSYEEAVKWYTKAAEQGDAYGQNDLGTMYQYGDGVNKSDEEALKWYTKAAEQGNAVGQRNLGVMYQTGSGVDKSYKEAVKWYTKSAEQGNADGQCNLGAMYEYGYGVDKSYEEAVKWYTKAAEQGAALGQFNLGDMYEYGKGVDKSYEEAVKWYRKAAEEENALGQNRLGFMYEKGWAVDKSYEEAVKWYRKAAEQGNAQGQFRLGFMHRYGDGVNKSYEEAVKWYTKAAEQGNAQGQFRLGIMYQYGYGVTQSDQEAVKWYKKAADQGNFGAIWQLENLEKNKS